MLYIPNALAGALLGPTAVIWPWYDSQALKSTYFVSSKDALTGTHIYGRHDAHRTSRKHEKSKESAPSGGGTIP